MARTFFFLQINIQSMLCFFAVDPSPRCGVSRIDRVIGEMGLLGYFGHTLIARVPLQK